MTVLLSSLRVFAKTTMPAIRQRSAFLHVYLRHLLTPLTIGSNPLIKLVTPESLDACGAQLSVRILGGQSVTEVAKRCHSMGLMVDERKPDMIRLSPTGLYNTFSDVNATATILAAVLKHSSS
jgi:kynureninase